MKSAAAKKAVKTLSSKILRFAHPFYTDTPPESRSETTGGLQRMTDSIKLNLEPIPKVKGQSIMSLEDIIGTDGVTGVETEKELIFHSFGDSGHENGTAQELVADAMTDDFDISKPSKSPAFLLHLGDVIYYDNTDKGYHAQFYVPYKKYAGKIIAIPGNHDGELFKWDQTSTGQKTTLEAFCKNFCCPDDAPTVSSGTVLRQMVSQPGVYWMLNTPFAQIIGLYSNIAENPGYIQAPEIGDVQKKWLDKTLIAIKKLRDKGTHKALIFAVHHPPISRGSHSSSTEMLKDIDDSCTKAGIMPDALLSAHAHDYQRFTRYVPFGGKTMEIPFFVVGTGGRGLSRTPAAATGQREGDHTYEKVYRGYGYLKTTVDASSIQFQFYSVNADTGHKKLFDHISVHLKSHKISSH